MLDAIVRSKRNETSDIVVLELVSAEGGEFPSFTPGAHIDVEVKPGVVRQYSLCNSASDTSCYRIAVLREKQSKGGSLAVHEAIQPGAQIRISEPRNLFPLREDGEHSILIAGGIGITPLLCMADYLHRRGRSFELHYCVRSRSQAAFLTELGTAGWQPSVRLHFDDEDVSQRIDIKEVLAVPDPGKDVYICGPEGLIVSVLDQALQLGWRQDSLHREYFSNNAAIARDADARGFVVAVRSSGQEFIVNPDSTIAETLIQNGISVPMSCEQGICGTCLTRVLDGVPDHRDMFMTPKEHAANDMIAICCSRSFSERLVLDL